MKLKKGSAEAKKFMASIRAKKKGPKKAAVKKAAVKKTPAKSYHKDTKSHNVKISVVSGQISKGKLMLIDNLTFLYGSLASEYIFATTQKEKNRLKKEMMNIKKDILNLKYNK